MIYSKKESFKKMYPFIHILIFLGIQDIRDKRILFTFKYIFLGEKVAETQKVKNNTHLSIRLYLFLEIKKKKKNYITVFLDSGCRRM